VITQEQIIRGHEFGQEVILGRYAFCKERNYWACVQTGRSPWDDNPRNRPILFLALESEHGRVRESLWQSDEIDRYMELVRSNQA
jgi:hypothetical protein